MNSLADVFRVLNEIRDGGLVDDYAVGGAMAALFYVEPTRTYDLDVFVILATEGSSSSLISLEPIYSWARSRGFPVDAEHILMHGVPVQFLPAYNDLVEEAVTTARSLDYEGVVVRVVDPPRLAALAIQAGGARRRERAWQLIESEGFDRALFLSVLARHRIEFEVSGDD